MPVYNVVVHVTVTVIGGFGSGKRTTTITQSRSYREREDLLSLLTPAIKDVVQSIGEELGVPNEIEKLVKNVDTRIEYWQV